MKESVDLNTRHVGHGVVNQSVVNFTARRSLKQVTRNHNDLTFMRDYVELRTAAIWMSRTSSVISKKLQVSLHEYLTALRSLMQVRNFQVVFELQF